MSDPEPVLRPAARVLLLDGAGRALLFRYVHEETGQAHWVTPGGGLLPGETHREAAMRELREETGLTEATIGPEIWFREEVFAWGGRLLRQQERFFLVRVDDWEIPPEIEAAHRLDGIDSHRWFTVEELEGMAETVWPRRLPSFLQALLESGPPADPLDVGI